MEDLVSNRDLRRIQTLNAVLDQQIRGGEYTAALKQALEIRDLVAGCLGEEHLAFADVLHNLAIVRQALGDYGQAEELYEQSMGILAHGLGEDSPELASLLYDQATLYERLGRYDDAERFFKRALALIQLAGGERNPEYARYLNGLAGVFNERGVFDQAQAAYERVLALLAAMRGKRGPEYDDVLNNLATVYHAQDDYVAAGTRYTEVLRRRRRRWGWHHPLVAQSLNNLAALRRNQGRYDEALRLLQRSLEVARTTLGTEHPSYAAVLMNLAGVLLAQRRPREALPRMQEAANIEDRVLGQAFSSGSERQRLDAAATFQQSLGIFLYVALEHADAAPEAIPAALDQVLRRKALGIEALAVQRQAALGGRYPHLLAGLEELQRLRQAITALALSDTGPTPAGASLAELNARRERLESDLARHVPEMDLARRLGQVDTRAVADQLPEGSALVEIVRLVDGPELVASANGSPGALPRAGSYVAFILTAGQPDAVDVCYLGAGEEIDPMIASFRATLAGGDRSVLPRPVETLATRNSVELRRAIFDPLVSALGGRRRVFLAPDGDLAQLPFQALPADGGGRLIDTYEISYVGAGRDLLRFATHGSGRPGAAVVVADPAFDLGGQPVRRPFGPLPGTRAEGHRVADLLGVEAIFGAAAVEARIKNSKSPRVLHIASHGFFLRHAGDGQAEAYDAGSGLERLARSDNPLLRSGIAMAGANTWNTGGTLPSEAEDGILTAEDVSGLDLTETDLVVLSACDTGLGEIRIGEGVFGLQRAFNLAGARTLIMSLWKVPDQQTFELMEDLYSRLVRGEPRSSALRAAQLTIMQRYHSVLYWGAFICQGNPGQLIKGPQFNGSG